MKSLESLSLKVILFVLSITATATSTRCHSDACYLCTDTKAQCYVTDVSDVIPQNLNTGLQSLQVVFKPQTNTTAELTKDMLLRYPNLRSLVLSGDFSSITFDALEHLSVLSTFNIKYSKVTEIPGKLFEMNRRLGELQLIGNRLTELPLLAFGDIKQPNLGRLYIKDNVGSIKLPCINGSMHFPTELVRYKSLRIMDFTNTQFHGDGCDRIDYHLLDVGLLHLSQLSLGGTNLLMGAQNILQPLKGLKYLQLNDLLPYKTCPSRVKDLLFNLPQNLLYLHLDKWESHGKLNESCLLSQTTLHGLSGLRRLNTLSFNYGDQVFGPHLSPDLIPEMSHLQIFQLNFCRLSSIDEHALGKYPNLSSLSLNGNPLGSKDYQVLPTPLLKVKSLSLQNSNIKSDQDFIYNAGGILCSYPNLESLDLMSNLMKEMPSFQTGATCNKTSLPSLISFTADSNKLTAFISDFRDPSDNICFAFPHLTKLHLNQNRLRFLDGLEECTYLEELYLKENHIGYGANHNGSKLDTAFKRLLHLTKIDLSGNNLRKIYSSTFRGLSKLRQLIFANNKVNTLEEGLFSSNTELEEIDLSWNFLKSVTRSSFSHLTKLNKLILNGNQITSFDKPFLDLVDMMPLLTELYIGNNPYDCSCGSDYFQVWANKTTKIYLEDKQFLTCGSPPSQKDVSVYTFQNSSFECYYETITIIAATIVAVFFLTLVIALPCYKYRWYVQHIRVVWNAFSETLETTKQEYVCSYDAYVSYDAKSHEDSQWVVSELLRNVEECQRESERRKLYVEGRDAGAGQSRVSERELALQKSRKILIVASKSYLRSASCLGEADIAGYQMHGLEFYQPNRIMVLVREELSEGEIIRPPMNSLLLGNVIEVEGDGRKEQMMWKKIRKFLAKPHYIYEKRKRKRRRSSASSSVAESPQSDEGLDSLNQSLEADNQMLIEN